MGSSYEDWVRGLPKPVGLAKVPRSSETRRRDCCRDAENWSRDPPNHSFSLLLMSARLMETVPGMVSCLYIAALSAVRGCPYALAARAALAVCEEPRRASALCFHVLCAAHAESAPRLRAALRVEEALHGE